jgi:hypothetical protein
LSGLSVEDIDSKDEYGNTLLLLACQYRCEDLVRIMLNKGADPNALNLSGACGLHFACYRESASYNVTKILLQNGANPDVAESTFGCTPLHYCAGAGDIEFCKLLLAYGAQIDAYDYYNYTCVDYAREASMTELAAFLQIRLEKAQNMSRLRSSASQQPEVAASLVASDWEPHTDPTTKGKYYMHVKTGEVVWENELLRRFQQQNTPFIINNNNNKRSISMKASMSTILENEADDINNNKSNKTLLQENSKSGLKLGFTLLVLQS